MSKQGFFYETKQHPYPYYGQKAYKIQLDLRLRHNPLQRHIWYMQDGGVDVEEWITTSIISRFDDEVESGHWTCVDELDPIAETEPQIIPAKEPIVKPGTQLSLI